MKQVTWATNRNRAFMGELISGNERVLIVKVTGVSSKRDAKLVGQKVAIAPAIATIKE